MRILIATTNRNLVGGIETYLKTLIPGLLHRGHQVALLYENQFDPKVESIDPPAAQLPAWRPAEVGVEIALRSVGEWKPGIVYVQGLDASSLESELLGTYPTVLYAHTYHGTCISGRKCHSLPQPTPCARRFGATCLLLYYPRRCGGLHPGTMWRLFMRQSQLNSRLRRWRAILVASKHMRQEFGRHGVNVDRTHLVPLPISSDLPRVTALHKKGLPGRILFVGRLLDLKGVDHLIKAIPQAAEHIGRPLSLTIAGDGPEWPKLRTLAHCIGIDAKFAGRVQTGQKVDLMRQADLLAVPSLWPEPFALVGIEAGCLGLPAVGYSVGGIPEWLIPGLSGELAPGDPPTVDGLANAIYRALADPDHYGKLCHGAWETATQYTLDAHLTNLEAVLEAAQ